MSLLDFLRDFAAFVVVLVAVVSILAFALTVKSKAVIQELRDANKDLRDARDDRDEQITRMEEANKAEVAKRAERDRKIADLERAVEVLQSTVTARPHWEALNQRIDSLSQLLAAHDLAMVKGLASLTSHIRDLATLLGARRRTEGTNDDR